LADITDPEDQKRLVDTPEELPHSQRGSSIWHFFRSLSRRLRLSFCVSLDFVMRMRSGREGLDSSRTEPVFPFLLWPIGFRGNSTQVRDGIKTKLIDIALTC
jgi:hypothetical protein